MKNSIILIIVASIFSGIFSGCLPKKSANGDGTTPNLSATITGVSGILAFSCVPLILTVTDDSGNGLSTIITEIASLSSANVLFYSDSNCQTNLTGIKLKPGTGAASFYGVSSAAGSQSVSATIDTETITSVNFTNGIASITFVSGNAQQIFEQAPASAPLVVQVSNSDGTPSIGVLVDLVPSDTTGNAVPSPAITNNTGQTQITITAPINDGGFNVTATVEVSNSIQAIASFNTIPPTP